MSEFPISEDTATIENLIKTESSLYRLGRDININISDSSVFEEEAKRIQEINESINQVSIKIFLKIFTAFKMNEEYKDLSQAAFSTFLDEFGILTKSLSYDDLFDMLEAEIDADPTINLFESMSKNKSSKENEKIIDDLLDGDTLNSLHFILKNFGSLEYKDNKMLLSLDIKDPTEISDSIFKEVISIDISNKRTFQNFMLKEHKKMRDEMKKFKGANSCTEFFNSDPNCEKVDITVKNALDYMKVADEYYDNLENFPELKSWFLQKYGDFRQWPLFKATIVSSPLLDGNNKCALFSLLYIKLKASGCFMIKNNSITKLSGCNYYDTSIQNQLMCSCGQRVNDNSKSPDCSSFNNDKNECLRPYCIGKCSSGLNICTSDTELLQCNNKSFDDPNFIYYTYLDFNPLSIIPVVSNLKIINSNNKKDSKFNFLFLGIILAILFLIGLILYFIIFF